MFSNYKEVFSITAMFIFVRAEQVSYCLLVWQKGQNNKIAKTAASQFLSVYGMVLNITLALVHTKKVALLLRTFPFPVA